MKRSFAIVLLLGVFLVNVDMICQSLCLSGDNDTGGGHTSHKTTRHDIPKSDICPAIHSAGHSSHHNMPKTFIKCCPDDKISLKYELARTKQVKDLMPYHYIISKIHSQETIFTNNEPAPLENTPEILS